MKRPERLRVLNEALSGNTKYIAPAMELLEKPPPKFVDFLMTHLTQESVGSAKVSKVVWAPELGIFCAGAETGAVKVVTSPDGITWTDQTTPAFGRLADFAWSPELGLLCAVSFDGGDRVMTSPDGITWTLRSTPSGDEKIYDIVWVSELSSFFAVCTTGPYRILKSTDGINWVGIDVGDLELSSISWSPELHRLVALTRGGDISSVCYSNDGENWLTNTLDVSYLWFRVRWSSTYQEFFATTASNAALYRSNDGIEWYPDPEVPKLSSLLVLPVDDLDLVIVHDITTAPNKIHYLTAGRWRELSIPGFAFLADGAWSPELGVFCLMAVKSSDPKVLRSLGPST